MDQVIDGIIVRELKQFKDERGIVMHMMRKDSDLYSGFGEVYFSVVNPGVIKGWKKHHVAIQHFTVPQGKMKIVLFDDRINSQTKGQLQELEIGIDDYKLLRIPAGIWYSFKAISDGTAMICNLTTITHDPKESENREIDDSYFPFHW